MRKSRAPGRKRARENVYKARGGYRQRRQWDHYVEEIKVFVDGLGLR